MHIYSRVTFTLTLFFMTYNAAALDLPEFLEHDCTVHTSRSSIFPQGNDPGGHYYVVMSLSSSTAVWGIEITTASS